MEVNQELRYAVLIDADNISFKYMKIIMDELANYGIATYRRIYGDWTDTRLSSWKSVLLDHSFSPIQQYSYTVGKSATDSAMIIDAMDILYSGNVNGFCIVSSDSDFTRLVVRLREAGMNVVGMGESKTPRPFIAACNSFKYLDILMNNALKLETTVVKKKKTSAAATKAKAAKEKEPEKEKTKDKERSVTDLDTIQDALLTIVEENSDEDGWLLSSNLGNILAKRYPDFDVRNFGCSKLTTFIESLGIFEIRRVKTDPHDNVHVVYIRSRQDA